MKVARSLGESEVAPAAAGRTIGINLEHTGRPATVRHEPDEVLELRLAAIEAREETAQPEVVLTQREVDDGILAFVGGTPGERVLAVAPFERVAAHATVERVVVAAADDPIGAGLAIEEVVPLTAVQRVVAGTAMHDISTA